MDIFVQLLINSLLSASVYGILAIGFSLLFKVAKFFNLAYGSIGVISAYFCYLLINIFDFNGLSVVFAIMVALVVGGLVSVLSYVAVFKKIERRKGSSTIMMIASLGIATCIQALVSMLAGSQPQSISRYVDTSSYRLLGGHITSAQIFIILAFFVLIGCVFYVFRNTLFGKQVLAIGDSVEMAQVIGMDTTWIAKITFFISGVVSSLVIIMTSLDTSIDPLIGLPLMLKAISASIIGGLSSVHGAILGAVIIGLVENFGIWHIGGEWKDFAVFLVLMGFLLMKPNGILGGRDV